MSLQNKLGLSPVIALLSLITLLAHVTVSGGRVTSSLFVLQHGGSALEAGLIYSLFSLLPAVLSVYMGRWIDHVGAAYAMRLSLLVMVLSLGLCALWPIMPVVFVVALISGLAFSCYLLSANVAVSYLPVVKESERVGMLAWLQMGASISAVLGPALSGVLIDASGFRAAYVAMSVIVVLGLLLVLRLHLPEAQQRKLRERGHGMARLLREDSLLRGILFLSIVIAMAWEAFAFMTPLLGHERGYSATSIGLVLSAFAVGTFISRASLPWLSSRLSEWRTLAYSSALTASVFFLLPFASNVTLHTGLGFVFGLSAGVCQPNLLSLLYRTMPKGRSGEGAGLRALVGSAVGLLGPSLYGLIAGVTGAVPIFVGVAVLMSAGAWQARHGRLRSESLAAQLATEKG